MDNQTNGAATPKTTASGKITSTSAGKVVLRRIFKNDFQKEGTLTAEVEQEVTTVNSYPSKKTTSDMQEGLFDESAFGFEREVHTSVEKRVAWILVPEGVTEDAVNAKLTAANNNGAVIYKVLSHQPILDENQTYAIKQGLRTKEDFANSQVCRYPMGHADEGKIILDGSANPMYRRVYFWSSPKADMDLRVPGDAVFYSKEIRDEIFTKGETV